MNTSSLLQPTSSSVPDTKSAEIIDPFGPTKNVAMAKNQPGNGGSQTQSEKLRDAALKEAHRVLAETDQKEQESDEAGWTLIELMLSLQETFINPATSTVDQAALEAFLVRHGAKQHGNTKNPMQRLTKVCFPNGTRADRVTKYGHALAAMTRREITSASVMAALSESGPVPEQGGLMRRGIHRFILLHREDMKRERRAKSPEAASNNKYLRMPDESLKAEALLIIEALREKGLLPFSPDEMVEALSN